MITKKVKEELKLVFREYFYECRYCRHCLKESRSFNGNTFYEQESMRIDEIPEVLAKLTETELALIARAIPLVLVYIFSRTPGQTAFFKTNCINVKNNVKQLALKLPRMPKDLPIVYIKRSNKERNLEPIRVRR